MGKKENAQILDPMRFKIAQQNAVVPGGPQNNNPMNVTDNASPVIQSQSIYGDHGPGLRTDGYWHGQPYGCWTFRGASQSRTWRCSRSRL